MHGFPLGISRWVGLVAGALLLSWGLAGLGGYSSAVASPPPTTTRVFVTDSVRNVVDVIDGDNGTHISAINVGSEPYAMVAPLSGDRIFVGNAASNTVSVIDPMTLTVVATIPVFARPIGLTLDGHGRLYVGHQYSSLVAVIDTASNSVVGSVLDTTSVTQGVASPDGTTVFLPSYDSQDVAVVDSASLAVSGTLTADSSGIGSVTRDPSGGKLFVGISGGGSPVEVFDLAGGTSRILTLSAVGGYARIQSSPDFTKLYAHNNEYTWVIDPVTESILATVPRAGGHSIGITPEGNTGFWGGVDASGVPVLTRFDLPTGLVREFPYPDARGVTFFVALVQPQTNPPPVEVLAAADAYLRQGASDTNEGGAPALRIQSSGNNRVLVHFDQTAIQAALGGGNLVSAKLRFSIVDNADNWGTAGRTLDLHRVTVPWFEGNGYVSGGSPPYRGVGSGATWRCAVDANISNEAKDCAGATEWSMSGPGQRPWEPTPTASVLIVNGQQGTIELDVTSDVQAWIQGAVANNGWILKKSQEGQPGRVDLGARESAAGPVLVIASTP